MDEDISNELLELVSAPASGIIFCNLLKQAEAEITVGVSMTPALPEAQGIKTHCCRLELKLQGGKPAATTADLLTEELPQSEARPSACRHWGPWPNGAGLPKALPI